jgi:hypothetical protein
MVYFIQSACPKGLIKIGNSDKPLTRLKELQTANGYKLTFLKIIQGGYQEELITKKRFRQFRVLEGGTEWFKPEKELLDYIKSLVLEQAFEMPTTYQEIPGKYDPSIISQTALLSLSSRRQLSKRTEISNEQLLSTVKKQELPSRIDFSLQIKLRRI